jgi:hypothetical protein
MQHTETVKRTGWQSIYTQKRLQLKPSTELREKPALHLQWVITGLTLTKNWLLDSRG